MTVHLRKLYIVITIMFNNKHELELKKTVQNCRSSYLFPSTEDKEPNKTVVEFSKHITHILSNIKYYPGLGYNRCTYVVQYPRDQGNIMFRKCHALLHSMFGDG